MACRTIRLLAIVAAVLTGAAASADDRLPALTTAAEQAQWPMIGRVNVKGIGSRRMCTGTLIAPDRVLTAAHCLVAPGGRARPDAAEVIFVAGWRQGAAVADREGAALEIHPAAAGLVPERIAGDLAVIHLARPIEAETAATLATAPLPDPALPLTILGYRHDRPHALSRQAGCRVIRRAAGAFSTDCPVVPGSSGAPVLERTEAGWRVVGIVSASSGGPGIGGESLAATVSDWPATR